jgi:hypothetical protein
MGRAPSFSSDLNKFCTSYNETFRFRFFNETLFCLLVIESGGKIALELFLVEKTLNVSLLRISENLEQKVEQKKTVPSKIYPNELNVGMSILQKAKIRNRNNKTAKIRNKTAKIRNKKQSATATKSKDEQ